MRIIKYVLLSVTAMFVLVGGLSTSRVLALDCGSTQTSQEAIQCGINNASGSTQTSADATTSVNTTVDNVVNVLSTFVGAVAVIMIMVGGFRYVTSGGKQESITSAKNSIMYALVGLVIVAFAQIIVQFILTKATVSCVNGYWDSGPHAHTKCK